MGDATSVTSIESLLAVVLERSQGKKSPADEIAWSYSDWECMGASGIHSRDEAKASFTVNGKLLDVRIRGSYDRAKRTKEMWLFVDVKEPRESIVGAELVGRGARNEIRISGKILTCASRQQRRRVAADLQQQSENVSRVLG